MPKSRRLLAEIIPALEAVADWSIAATEAAVKAFAGARGLKLGKVAQPLRAALTGRTASPESSRFSPFLAAEESLARIADQAQT